MKKITQIIIAFFLIVCLNYDDQKIAAQNLVPNPSFEDTLFCPQFLTQLYATSNWLNFGITPDFFHSCNNSSLNVPNSILGFQYAHTGSAMAGLFIRRKPNSPNGPNAREYIATELLNNLNIGSRYFFACYINFSYIPQGAIACNKFGIKLSTVAYDSSQYSLLVNNFAHIYSDSIVSDSTQWFKLSGSVIADSSYLYLILGNFFTDQLTDTLSLTPLHEYSYYYLDDVCLSLDSNYCENWTSQKENEIKREDFIRIFPLPATNKISIKCSSSITAIEVYDLTGRQLSSHLDAKGTITELDISHFSPGYFFLKILTNSSTYYKKCLKI